MNGLPCVSVPRGDATKPGTAFRFTIDRPATVYLLVHKRGGYVPKGWQSTKLKARWQVAQYTVTDLIFRKDFPAGEVAIPAHQGLTASGKPPYGVGHLAVIQSKAEQASVPEQEIKIGDLSPGGLLRQAPTRMIMGGISMVVPDAFRGGQFVCMPRGPSAEPGRGFSFTIDRDSDVYISVHQRGTPTLTGWVKTNHRTIWRHAGNLHQDLVYRKHFPAGRVTIPPHDGSNGKMYGIPHVAMIVFSPNRLRPLVSWDWPTLGVKPLAGQTSLNNKPIAKITSPRQLILPLPAGTVPGDTVYNLRIWMRQNENQTIRVTVPPALSQPFGNRFMPGPAWKAVNCPIAISRQAARQNQTLTLELPAGAFLEAPILEQNDSDIRPAPNQVVKYYANRDWKPVNMGPSDGFFQAIKKGTALDFSHLPTRVPSGKKGRLIVNRAGRLAFEKDPDAPVRFRAASFPLLTGYCKTRAGADREISALERQGYNMVRFHGVIRRFAKGKYNRFGVTIDQATFVPQTPAEFSEFFDEEKLKLFDYVLDELGKRGIYVYMDVMTAYTGWTDAMQAGHWVGKDLLGQQFHAQLYVNDAYRRNWKEGITYLLNRTNTVNGRQWKDDPTLACMLFMNEQNFRVTPSYLSAFQNEWKARCGADSPDLSERLLKSDSPCGRAAGEFMLAKVQEMTDFFYRSIREAGYPGLVTNWDLYMRMIDAPAREKLSVVSMHSYHGHPGLPTARTSVPGYPVSARGKKEIRINHKSSIRDHGAYLSRILAMRRIDRPAMIMEYADTPPNPYRHEAGLFFAGYAAFNDIDVLMPHGYIVPRPFKPLTPYAYSSFCDPIFRASDAINAFAFLRGDVATGRHNVEFEVTPAILNSPNRIDALAREYAQLCFLTKIGTRYTGSQCLDKVGEVQPDLRIEPKVFARARGTSVEAVTTDDEAQRPKIFTDLVSDLRRRNILSPANRTDAAKGVFESETGELLMKPREGVMLVNTPRLEGAVLKQDEPVTINALRVESCSVPAAVTMISLDDKKDLAASKHLLLVFATHCINSGMVTNAAGTRLLEVGGAPLLMKTAKLSLSLKNGHRGTPRVYALNLDGTRAETLEAQQDAAGLHLNVETAALAFGTPFFEIIY
jgi:hypothetical protein